MLNVALTSLLLSNPAVLPTEAADGASGTLLVEVSGFQNDYGQALMYVFKTKSGFPSKPARAAFKFRVPINNKRASFAVDLPVHEYAAFVVHDYNGNGELDTNWLGIPKEGVGASNNAKGRMGPPKYRDAKFELTATGTRQAIKLVYI